MPQIYTISYGQMVLGIHATNIYVHDNDIFILILLLFYFMTTVISQLLNSFPCLILKCSKDDTQLLFGGNITCV